jgi:hypothetical protein
MTTNFCYFCQFAAKKLAFFLKKIKLRSKFEQIVFTPAVSRFKLIRIKSGSTRYIYVGGWIFHAKDEVRFHTYIPTLWSVLWKEDKILESVLFFKNKDCQLGVNHRNILTLASLTHQHLKAQVSLHLHWQKGSWSRIKHRPWPFSQPLSLKW